MNFNQNELNKIKYAGKVLSNLLDKYIPSILKIGVSGIYLEKLITEYIVKNNCIPALKGYYVNENVYLYSICCSINNVAIHGVPNFYKLKNGDLVGIDCVVNYQGINVDAARTYLVGDNTKNKFFLDKCNNIFDSICKYINLDTSILDLAKYIDGIITKNNFGNLFDYSGHHIGYEIHEKPSIINHPSQFSPGASDLKLRGLFTIEPIIVGNKNFDYFISNDMWSVVTSCSLTFHKEHTILIQNNKIEFIV